MSENAESGAEGAGPKVGSGAYFAAMYGANERTVKRWKATGKSSGDATPLENPEAMLAWWPRNMSQRVPDGINAAVIRWRKENLTAAAAGPVVGEAPVLELPVVVPDVDRAAVRRAVLDLPIEEGEIGPEQTLRRLLELEPRLHRLATEPGAAKDYLGTVARIGPAAKALNDENVRMRKYIPKAEAEEAIQALHVPIKNEIYMLGATMCTVLGVPVTPAIEELWRVECDRIFHRLKNEVFAA